jgi:hypothetical protein
MATSFDFLNEGHRYGGHRCGGCGKTRCVCRTVSGASMILGESGTACGGCRDGYCDACDRVSGQCLCEGGAEHDPAKHAAAPEHGCECGHEGCDGDECPDGDCEHDHEEKSESMIMTAVQAGATAAAAGAGKHVMSMAGDKTKAAIKSAADKVKAKFGKKPDEPEPTIRAPKFRDGDYDSHNRFVGADEDFDVLNSTHEELLEALAQTPVSAVRKPTPKPGLYAVTDVGESRATGKAVTSKAVVKADSAEQAATKVKKPGAGFVRQSAKPVQGV